jgi:hypothetical protein
MTEFLPITDTAEIREQVARIADSSSFRRRRRLLELLEYLVAETLAGRTSQLTQKKIAADVFGLNDSIAPQSDVTVRISASRLRDSLDDYYRREAQPDEVRICLPPRHYYIAVEQSKRVTPPYPNSIDEQYRPDESGSAKKISQNAIVGEQGINLIEKVCLDLGFPWYPTRLEAGIDGYFEIRHQNGEVTNCIVQVQSKATDRPFESETASGFEFRCTPRDLDYWLSGNAPVILVRSRPRTSEAYWMALKEYFADLSRRKSGKIIFDKTKDRFDVSAKARLQQLAVANSGLYLGTRPKSEIVYSNLLELTSFPKKYYVAVTDYRTPAEIFATLREFNRVTHGEWILHSKTLSSFHDLSTSSWSKVCDRGSVEELDTGEWAQTNDSARERQFVQLLNQCLKGKLYPKGIKFSRENQCYYFRAPQDLSGREYAYQSREHKASRLVFRGYPRKSDHTQMSFYRHSAFGARFVRFGAIWYLQITPTYHFTRDGERISRFAPDLLSGIKRLETNQAVHGQVVMWAHLLTERSLFDTGPQFLHFGSPLDFHLDVGLDDDAWLKREEDPEKRTALQAPAIDEPQGSFIL